MPFCLLLAVVTTCVFDNSTLWDKVDDSSSELESYMSDFIADIIEARGYVFGFGFGVALAVAFLYIGVLQIPGLVAVIVWGCILVILAALVILGYGLWITAEDWDDDGTKGDVRLR